MTKTESMTVAEAKERITTEFIEAFYEWLDDLKLPIDEYWKKGYTSRPREDVVVKDNLQGIVRFQKNIFCGRWLKHWKEFGFTYYILTELEKEGFLSHQQYWNRYKHPDTDFFYISQKTAKAIYKENKARMKHC